MTNNHCVSVKGKEKRRFFSSDTAMLHAKEEKKRKYSHPPTHIYHCATCGGWHIGTSKPRNLDANTILVEGKLD